MVLFLAPPAPTPQNGCSKPLALLQAQLVRLIGTRPGGKVLNSKPSRLNSSGCELTVEILLELKPRPRQVYKNSLLRLACSFGRLPTGLSSSTGVLHLIYTRRPLSSLWSLPLLVSC